MLRKSNDDAFTRKLQTESSREKVCDLEPGDYTLTLAFNGDNHGKLTVTAYTEEGYNKFLNPEQEEPEVTDEPEPTEEPEVTEEPEPTEEPKVTEETEPTEEPEVTGEPEVTEGTEPTEESEVTEVPEVTEEPEQTEEPEVTEEPKVTEETEPMEGPEGTEVPEVTEEPEPTEELEGTEVPEVTEGTEPTEEPEVTEKPEVTEETEPTEEPEVTEEPEITEEPVKTAQMLAQMIDEIDPNRTIDIYIEFNGDALELGDLVTLRGELHGYDNCTYSLQWQESLDDVNFTDVEGETNLTYTFPLTEEKCVTFWRLAVRISDVTEE
jgi:hypothetical protein